MSVVFALATPPAKSAICVFRVSGSGCFDGLSKLIKGSGYDFGSFHLKSFFGVDGLVDKAGLVVFKGPNSYTGEDSFEVTRMVVLLLCLRLLRLLKVLGLKRLRVVSLLKGRF